MNELWTVLTPILLADIVNPVLFAFLVYAAGTNKPVSTSTALLLGHTAAYFTAGVAIAIGLEQFENRLANPKPVDFAFEFFIGVLLLWIGARSRNSSEQHTESATKNLTFVSAIFLGAMVNFVGIPFAIPYFAALSQILKADITATQAWATLVAYNLAYALPFASVPIMRALVGEKSRPFLEKINGYLNKASSVLMPFLLIVLGVALVTDAVYYYVKGVALF
jgi:cytochrome c biogenesis protein CcdA